MTIQEKIASRGYWSVRIRPETYDPDLELPLERLEAAVKTSSVNLRGWDLPHYNINDPIRRMTDFVQQEIEWGQYVELWRAYRSRQFALVKGMPEDWFDQKGTFFQPPPNWKKETLLFVEDAVCRFVEIFEFAARWTTALSLKGSVVVEIKLEKLQGRALHMLGPRVPFHSPKTCDAPGWAWRHPRSSIPVADLVSSTRDLATSAAVSLFELFRWDVRPETIKDIQRELRGFR